MDDRITLEEEVAKYIVNFCTLNNVEINVYKLNIIMYFVYIYSVISLNGKDICLFDANGSLTPEVGFVKFLNTYYEFCGFGKDKLNNIVCREPHPVSKFRFTNVVERYRKGFVLGLNHLLLNLIKKDFFELKRMLCAEPTFKEAISKGSLTITRGEIISEWLPKIKEEAQPLLRMLDYRQ